jgi:translocation and assembly module TamB
VPLARDGGDWRIVPQAPLAGRLRAQVPDLSWVGPAIDGNLTSGGRLEIDGELAGTLRQPRTRGHLRGSGLALGWLDQNVNLRQGTLDARFEQERIRLERLEFSAPHAPPARAARIAGLSAAQAPGRLHLQGSLDLAARGGRIEATLERLPLAQRPERWVVASGRGQADLAGELLTLGARIVADAGFIAQAGAGQPQLADDVVIVGRDAAPRRALRVDSEIALDLGERFHLRAGGLEARLGGQLRLRGEPGRPLRASGMIATHDGVFEAYGQRLTVERGIVNFQGPLDDPGLNVLAVRKGLSVEAGVAVGGTVQRPVVRLVSTPAVPDPEKLSWIVLGRVPDAGGTDASLLLTAAGAILGGQADGLTGQLAQALGVDELALRQAREGDPLTSQILTVGKRLSARAFLSYEQGLAATAGAMKLSYALTPRVSLVTRAGADNALDLFYTFSFD